jgi:hypothetical protein
MLVGGDLSSLMVGVDARYKFPIPLGPVRPVIVGGLGIAKVGISDLSDTYSVTRFASEKRFYVEIGAGLVLKLGGNTSLFMTARYVTVAVEGASLDYSPITFGVTF